MWKDLGSGNHKLPGFSKFNQTIKILHFTLEIKITLKQAMEIKS
jgi:type II secretory pathway component PulF